MPAIPVANSANERDPETRGAAICELLSHAYPRRARVGVGQHLPRPATGPYAGTAFAKTSR